MSSLYFLSESGSHIAYSIPAQGTGQRVYAAPVLRSFGVEAYAHQPLPGWVVCTQAEFERIRDIALSSLGLVDTTALVLAQVEAYEAEQAALLPL